MGTGHLEATPKAEFTAIQRVWKMVHIHGKMATFWGKTMRIRLNIRTVGFHGFPHHFLGIPKPQKGHSHPRLAQAKNACSSDTLRKWKAFWQVNFQFFRVRYGKIYWLEFESMADSTGAEKNHQFCDKPPQFDWNFIMLNNFFVSYPLVNIQKTMANHHF